MILPADYLISHLHNLSKFLEVTFENQITLLEVKPNVGVIVTIPVNEVVKSDEELE